MNISAEFRAKYQDVAVPSEPVTLLLVTCYMWNRKCLWNNETDVYHCEPKKKLGRYKPTFASMPPKNRQEHVHHSTQRDIMKLGTNPYHIQIMQDLRDVNEEKGLSFMRYNEDECVQKIILKHWKIWWPIKYRKKKKALIQTFKHYKSFQQIWWKQSVHVMKVDIFNACNNIL